MSNGLLNASGLTTPKVTTDEIILRGKPISEIVNDYEGTKIFIVESYISEDGKAWYRKYSDGWIEQGGHVSMDNSNHWRTVTLPLSFSNTKYTLCLSAQIYGNTSATAPSSLVSEARGARTAQTFAWFFHGANSNYGADFYACGY